MFDRRRYQTMKGVVVYHGGIRRWRIFVAVFTPILSRLRLWRRALWRYYIFKLRRHLPAGLRRGIGPLYATYIFWRVSPRVTNLLGPRYRRSRDRIDIDITWECNLRCFHCNRSCQQAPTQERMTVGQIRRFLEETREKDVHWQKINLIGGEPTLHPNFDEVLGMVLEFRDRHSPGTNVMVITNGFGGEVNAVLARIPEGVDLRNTRKTSRRHDDFIPFNLAPCDAPEYARADFRNGCCVTRDAGIGLTPYGYYPCVGAGAIDRIFGFDRGRKTLPNPEDSMEEDLALFCSLCGFFRLNYTSDVREESLMSPTWERAYAAWYAQIPELSRFPEC
jgi:hypothetical protein